MGGDLSDQYFPFDRLELRGNPFRALTEDEWASLAWLQPVLLEALDQPLPILQVLGERGRGKSSALLGIKRELLARGRDPNYFYLPPGVHHLQRNQQIGDPLLLDEIERLPVRNRRRLFRSSLRNPGEKPRLVFSSHSDLTGEIEKLRPGILTSVSIPTITTGQLAELLHNRIRSASASGDLPVWFEEGAIKLLLETYSDDLRTMERSLYEVFQRLETPGEIDRDRLRRLVELSGGRLAPG